MEPLTVTAHLETPPAIDRPVLLDAIILAGLGARMGAAHPSGWEDEALVEACPLPLAQVETPHGWWYAASQVTPAGPEQQSHLNRVPLVEEYARWTSRRSVNVAAGADKRLRVPYYYRPGMLELVWTCVGDADQVADLLANVPGVGRMVAHGHGWVRRWDVDRGGPPLEAYGEDLALRHLPVPLVEDLPADVMRRSVPLRPPYHRRRNGVPCWQVQRVGAS